MGEVLDAFGLLDFTTLRPVLALFLSFFNFFRAAVSRGYGGTVCVCVCVCVY